MAKGTGTMFFFQIWHPRPVDMLTCSQMLRVCLSCKKSKVKCGPWPCSRCKRLQVNSSRKCVCSNHMHSCLMSLQIDCILPSADSKCSKHKIDFDCQGANSDSSKANLVAGRSRVRREILSTDKHDEACLDLASALGPESTGQQKVQHGRR